MARAGTLPTVLTGVFVAILDFFIVNVAIPTMQRDLRAGPAAVEWVVAGYALAYGSGLVLGGRLGDVFGRRRMFALGLALFRERAVTAGLLTNLAFSMGMAAYFLIFAMYSQEGRGLDALHAGLVFTPIGAGYLAASLAAPRLAAQQVGGALGVGIIGIVFYSALSGGVTVAFQHGLVYLIVITLAIAALVQWLPRARAAA